MPTPLITRPRRHLVAWLAAALLIAAAVPVSAAPGNNGTVKVHNGDAAAGDEPAPEIRNEPHVGCFHAHFFFADVDQSGRFWIDAHPPTDGGTVYSGSYDTEGGTEYATELIGLEAGHYKLYWQGDPTERVKHKTFWVDEGCDEEPPGG